MYRWILDIVNNQQETCLCKHFYCFMGIGQCPLGMSQGQWYTICEFRCLNLDFLFARALMKSKAKQLVMAWKSWCWFSRGQGIRFRCWWYPDCFLSAPTFPQLFLLLFSVLLRGQNCNIFAHECAIIQTTGKFDALYFRSPTLLSYCVHPTCKFAYTCNTNRHTMASFDLGDDIAEAEEANFPPRVQSFFWFCLRWAPIFCLWWCAPSKRACGPPMSRPGGRELWAAAQPHFEGGSDHTTEQNNRPTLPVPQRSAELTTSKSKCTFYIVFKWFWGRRAAANDLNPDS